MDQEVWFFVDGHSDLAVVRDDGLMPDYNIDRLGDRTFEQLVVSLAAHVLGPGVSAFGDGADGGREATYEGSINWSATTTDGDDIWSGYTVIQAKFHYHPTSVKSNASWLKAEITKELDRWVEALGKGSRIRAPHYLIVASNVRLSPAGVVGGIDTLQEHFTSVLADRTHPVGRLGIREIRLWHADQIHTLLDGAETVRRAFPALLTVGDVLARIDNTLVRNPTVHPPFAELRRDYTVGLRQRLRSIDLEILAPPGEFSDHPVMGLESIFVPQSVRADLAPVELPKSLRQILIDGGQITDHELPNFVDKQHLEALRRAYHARPPEPVLDAVAAPQRRRTVLLGDPGAGKSAFARYLVLRLAAPHGDEPSQLPLVSQPISPMLQPAPVAPDFEIVANHPVPDQEDVPTYLRRIAPTCLPRNIAGMRTSSNTPGDDELGRIADAWVYIRTLVQKYSPALQAMLHGAKPHAINGDVLELRHDFGQLAVRLSDPSNTSALATAIEIVTGREYTIRWLVPAPSARDNHSDEPIETIPVRPAGDLSHLAGWLPVWIELRNYASHQPQCNTVLDFLDMQYANEHFGFPKDLLDDYLRQDGRAVVVFDGLDEIFDPRIREQVTRQIEGFARRYNRVRILVTSRVLGYRRKLLADTGFDHLTLQDLTRGQIGEFAHRWSTHAYPHNLAEATQMRHRLLTAIDKSTAVGELAANPLLLTILASAARHSDLPRDRHSVLRHAVTVLVEQWDTSKLLSDDRPDAIKLDGHDKLRLLHLAARRMHDADAASGNHCPGPVLVEQFREYLCRTLYLPADQAVLAARTMLTRFRERNGLLAHLGSDVYGFIHRAFLDYLAADDIQARFRNNELTAQELVTAFVTKAGDSAWTAALLLTSKMLPDSLRVTLSAELINHGDTAMVYDSGHTDPDDDYWEELVPTLHTSLALSILGGLLPTATATTFGPHTADITRGITRLLEESCRAESQRLSGAVSSVSSLLGHRWWVDRRQYLSWYQTFFSHPRYHLPPTSDWFLGQTASWKQAACLYVDLHPRDRRTLSRFTQSTDPMLCLLALERLVKSHATHPDTLEILRRHALRNTTPEGREIAVSAVGEFWTGHPETLELLHARTTDESFEVRLCALTQLVRHWPTDTATLPRLVAAIADDPDDELRVEMVKASATSWPNDPRIVEALCGRVFEDTSHSVRLDALETLIAMNTDDELLYRIVDHARGDEEEAVYVVADTAHASITPRLVLRHAGFKPVGPTTETVAAVTVANADSLIYNADATAIIEPGSNFAQQLNDTCTHLLNQNSFADTGGLLYIALHPDHRWRQVWRQVRISGEPDFADLLRGELAPRQQPGVGHRGPTHLPRRSRPTTCFVLTAFDGHALLGVRINNDHTFVTLATRPGNLLE
ncbi:HEAT repeat domain-containing protein [Nocardia sp. NPDC088792]|uniref:HEAT repeat domain-containing protein n=1 Tax=Nocardia sp. NPDC088792 TaxID=3364332 RepID=UPI003817754C